MLILGLQKLTLLDYPGRTACTVFTGGCNFRCPFCHNAPLVLPGREQEPYTEEEVLSYLKKRAGLLDGVCVTGGEPTLQEDLEAFLRQVRALGYPVKLDTNGSRPEALRALLRQGLADYVLRALHVRKEQNGRDDVLGLAEEAYGYLSLEALDVSFGVSVGKLCLYKARRDAVDADAVLRHLNGDGLGEHLDTGLCGAVGQHLSAHP